MSASEIWNYVLVKIDWILSDVDCFDLCVIVKCFFAIDATAGATRNALVTVGQAVGNRVVAIDLTGTVPELLSQGHTTLYILCSYTGPESIR